MDLNVNGSVPTAGRRKGGAASRVFVSAVAVLVLALAASCGATSGDSSGQQPAGTAQEKASPVDQALGREPLGEATAPVVLTEYADYQ